MMATGRRLLYGGIAAALAALGGIALIASPATAAPGDLHFLGCISGEEAALFAMGGSCAPAPSPAPDGARSAFDNVTSVVVSPDGADVYAVSEADDAIIALRRDPSSGALSFVNCISGDSAGVPCTQAPHATSGGASSGMNSLSDAIVSPDGRQVYATAPFDDAIVVFDRDPAGGALSWSGCLTGKKSAGVSEGASCVEAPNSGLGFDTGLYGMRHLAISADGADVYGSGVSDAALTTFHRDPLSGALDFQGCVTGKTGATTGEGGNCDEAVPGATSSGALTALDDVHSVAVSPGGDYVYTTSEDEAAIAAFPRDAGGALSFGSCVTGSNGAISGSGGCSTPPYSATQGITSGLARLFDVAVSPDGREIYAVSQADDAISTFRHAPGSGALLFVGCLTANNSASTLVGRNCAPLPGSSPDGKGSGLDSTVSIAVAPDGKRLYTAASADAAVSAFDRDPDSGALAPAGCLAGDPVAVNCTLTPRSAAGGAGTGMDSLDSVAVSPSGAALYTAAFADDAVAWLEVEPPPQASSGGSGPGSAQSAPSDITAPKLSGLRIVPRAFSVAPRRTGRARSSARRRGSPRVRPGATVSYELSEPAHVQIHVQRILPGLRKRVHGKRRCVKPSRALRRSGAKHCRRFRDIHGGSSDEGLRGHNSFRFTGRLGRRPLSPGRYRMVLLATDAAGNVSRPATQTFRIVAQHRSRG